MNFRKHLFSIKIFKRIFLLAALLVPLLFDASLAERPSTVLLMHVSGVIGHATKNYVIRGIKLAEERKSQLVIITIDTPGGLMDSMKDIATAMINAKLPVAVYVYPNGSTATSAGFFILMASDFAAMAPDTSAGSAHPVSMGGEQMDGTMKEKTTNYAIKYMEQLVARRGRNEKIGHNAVQRSISVTADEALKKNVIEIIATSVDDLLEQLDGRTLVKGGQNTAEAPAGSADRELLDTLKNDPSSVTLTDSGKLVVDLAVANEKTKKMLRSRGLLKNEGKRFILHTKNAPVERLDMSMREKFFQTIGHPQIAYILFIVGIYAVIFEVTHAGMIAPGVIGVLCLIVAFTAFQVIPINAVGLVLIAGAFVLFILELKVVSHGLLTLGGISLMVLGSLMLVDSPDPAMQIDIGLILSIAGTTAFLIVVALAAIIKTHGKKVMTGEQGMIGLKGNVSVRLDPAGKISVRGEYWNARSETGQPIDAGDMVEVAAVDGMSLIVRKIV
jgi:membrane-bound serine protease (ClpP class)